MQLSNMKIPLLLGKALSTISLHMHFYQTINVQQITEIKGAGDASKLDQSVADRPCQKITIISRRDGPENSKRHRSEDRSV